MCDESDQEISELDIESRTWSKIEKNMKLMGFREGAARGQELSLQEGFNLGYSDGFKLGEYLGIAKGVLSCETEIKVQVEEKSQFKEEVVINLSNQACVLCSEEKVKASHGEETGFKDFEELISAQQSVNSEIMTTLKKLDSKSYLEKG